MFPNISVYMDENQKKHLLKEVIIAVENVLWLDQFIKSSWWQLS